MAGAVPLGGTCDSRFAGLRDALAANLADRGEIGAAVCVIVDGRVVCDLWGGWRDSGRTRPWERDTLANVFSVGKGVSAALVARLAGSGLLDPGDPVARYWPEFARSGKESVTVCQLLSHQGGLPSVRRRMPPGAMLDHRLMADALAAQSPWWEPGTAHGYHTNTFGFLVGEVVRRVSGRSLGTCLREEVAGPLRADLHIGLPRSEHGRVAEFDWPGDPAPEAEPEGLSDAALMEHNAYWNPSGLSGYGVLNTPEWREAEIPSTNGHATARGVARLYEALANGGTTRDGITVVDRGALREATAEQVQGEDLVLHRVSRFSMGFQLTQPERPLGPGGAAFGHFGAGGSLGFCDPERRLAFGYVINRMGPRWQNPCNKALIDATFEALGS